ncbi:hypothetical protein [Terasakiella pusilla]|uniref:hypothetical protein n=1 Tax=Terasakiella pusilla TaxID=64973 RepID=UPI003AA94892
MEEKTIRVTMLLVDESNFRIGEYDTQRDAIHAIIEEQGKKLVVLAEHILANKLSPIERLVVVEDEENPTDADEENKKYIVCEGNRRVSALKLMANPRLAEGTELAAAFKRLAKKFETDPINEVNCIVMDDTVKAFEWIELRHSSGLGGAGLEQWGAVAKTHAEAAKGKKRRWLSVFNFLKEQGGDTSDLLAGVRKKTTALDRVFGSSAMNEHLGITFSKDYEVVIENGEAEDGKVLLWKMLETMADDDFSTNDVHGFEDREEFIVGFSDYNVKKMPQSGSGSKGGSGGRGSGSGSGSGSGGKPNGGRGGKKPNGGKKKSPSDRATLARTGRDDGYNISDPRLNDLYKELKKIKVGTYPAISSVMIRVFLELSTVAYIEENDISPPNPKASGGWADYKLKEKVRAVVHHIDPKKTNEKLDMVRKGLSGDKDWLHSVENLHSYVHDSSADPSGKESIKIWDRYHEYFMLIH